MSCLLVSEMNSLWVSWFAHISSHSGLLLSFLKVSFAEHLLLNWSWSCFPIFSVFFIALWDGLKKTLQFLSSHVLPLFSLRFSKNHSWTFSSVAQSCPTLCDPMNRSTPGLPVHHQLPGFTQIHVHRVGDAIQPSHPLSSPSLPAPSPSQHQGLFQWINSSDEVAKVLEFQLQHQSLKWTPRTDLFQDGLVGSPCSPRDFQESSPTPHFKASIFRCSAFFIVQLSHPYMTTGKTIALTRRTLLAK